MTNKSIASGFTMVELLVVIALMGILVGLSIPFYQSFQVSSQLDNTSFEIIQTLRLAQANAISGENEETFGIHFEQQRYTLFQGDIYNSNDSSNEINDIPGTLNISTTFGQDIIFSRIKGEASVAGTVTISSNTNESKVIKINAKGSIDQI